MRKGYGGEPGDKQAVLQPAGAESAR